MRPAGSSSSSSDDDTGRVELPAEGVVLAEAADMAGTGTHADGLGEPAPTPGGGEAGDSDLDA